jgi:medium-chain acyl-[acyl-carrier-protein] hydrolase
MTIERITPWLLAMRPPDRVRARIFCLPFAGSGASMFRRWSSHAREGVELCAVQLPGREDRFAQPAATRIAEVIAPVADKICRYADVPFALFGHSMGALIAFELTRELRRRRAPLPVHLFVSGRRASHLPTRHADLHTLPPAEFTAELRKLRGTPAAVLDDAELMDLLTPLLRADFALCETYRYADEEPLEVPITAFGGTEDNEATVEELQGWTRHTRRFGGVQMFPGDHFFLQEHGPAMTQVMRDEIRMATAPR